MADSFIKYAFISGEVSPTLFGRTDLEQYDFGMERIANWFLDYRGGLSTRPGTEIVDLISAVEERTKMFKFVFGLDIEDNYLVVFDKDVIRFVQDGAFVLEPVKTVTELLIGVNTVITSPSHGYNVGDLFYVFDVGSMSTPGRLFRAGSVTTDTILLLEPNGWTFDSTGTVPYGGSGGTMQRVYGVPHTYSDDELENLRSYQIRDTLRLTQPDGPIRNLKRIDHTNWTLTDEAIGNGGTVPTGLVATASGAGSASVGFMVTAVSRDGVESLASKMLIKTGIVDYSTTAGHVTLNWTAVPNTSYYNVYRTLIMPGGAGSDVTGAEQVGFLGQAWAPQFVDRNIIPDFTITPPIGNNPFAPGAIEHIEITAGGTGYSTGATVSVSGGGSGFSGFPIVNNGSIIGVQIVNGGSGYVSPVVSFTGGTGATATATVGASTGIFPRVSVVFQQRDVYAGSHNDPLTLWGSVPGQFSLFDVSRVSAADDSFELEVDSAQVEPIQHLIVARGGLLVMSRYGIWQLQSAAGGPLTPTDATAEPQNFKGASALPPLVIDTDMLHMEGKSTNIHILGYNDITKIYSGQEVSYLSNHLFTSDNPIVAWDWTGDPYKLVWAARRDGSMLTFTLFKEQKVLYGWAPSYTKGLVTDVCSVPENGVDRVYLTVKRKLNGRWVKMIERVASRDVPFVEDSWCVDAGLTNTPNYPAATLTPFGTEGDVIFQTNVNIFTDDDVGKVIRAGGAKGTIIEKNTAASVLVRIDVDRPLTALIPEGGGPKTLAAGEWTMDAPFTTIRGLWHLIGETVDILADGNVIAPKTVAADGTLNLGVPVTRAIIGLKFTPVARTLPLTATQAVIESRTKRVVQIAARVTKSRGLKWGPSLDDMEEIKERTDEAYGAPVRLQDGVQFAILNSGFDDNGQVWLRQDNPLPATVTGLVLETEVGS